MVNMLRLTRVTDYGILLMTQLAHSQSIALNTRLTANDLAVATHVPAPTVSKILQSLLKAGLLDSVRGAHGGYQLSRSAGAISLREIIHCLEGQIALTECNLESGACDQSSVCSTRNNWKRINDAMHDSLESISLADMADDSFRPVFIPVKGKLLAKGNASQEKVIPIQAVDLTEGAVS